jgi:hypothetical protein
MAAIFTFDPSSIEGLAKVGVHVCYSAALKGSMSERRSDTSDDVTAEFVLQSRFYFCSTISPKHQSTTLPALGTP